METALVVAQHGCPYTDVGGRYYCFKDNPLEEAARIMAEHQVGRLPVLNRNQQLVGIVAIADIVRAGDREAEDTAIEGGIAAIRPRRLKHAADSLVRSYS